MRPLSEAIRQLLTCEAGYCARGRVRVLGPDSQWHNLSNLFGWDFLEDVTVDESLDMPVASATVRVRRELLGPGDGLSLAPLVTTSRANLLAGTYAPLLDPGRLFRVEVGLAPLGMSPGAGAWLPLFLGRIDDVDSGPEVLTFKGRDYYGGVLQDVWLEAERVYGSDAGTALQVVLGQILSDARLSSFGLYAPVTPEMVLSRFKQAVEPVMDALQKLALQRGWEVRQKLRPDTGDWGLWLWGPDRAGTTVAWSYGPSEYTELGELVTSLADIRTAVEVVYSDRADKDAAGQPKRKTVRRENLVALARYGVFAPDGTRLHRFARIAEDAASEIDTLAAAQRFGDSFLADLSSADMGVSVEVAVHPGLELGDVVELTGNRRNFTAAQRLAVRQMSHVLNSGAARTRLSLRGKPSLSERAWLSMEARPGIAPAAAFTGPAAPSGLTVTNAVGGAVILFTAPSAVEGPEADGYELHVGTSPGFVLDTSPNSTTLKAWNSATRFDVSGLVAGSNYYARVVSRDRKGNRGPASAEVTLSPRYVTPASLQPAVTFGMLPPNGDFESVTDSTKPPDTFSLSGGSWGNDCIHSTDAYAGKNAVVFPAGKAPATLSAQIFTVRAGEQWTISAWYKQSVVGARSGTLGITWLQSPVSAIGFSSVPMGPGTVFSASWYRAVVSVAVPLGARYAAVTVEKWTGYAGALTLDSVDALRQQAFEAWRDVSWEAAGGWFGANEAIWGPVRYRKNDMGEVQFRGVAGAPSPAPPANSVLFFLPPGYLPLTRRLWRTLTATQVVNLEVYPDGGVRVASVPAFATVPLDGFSFQAEQ